MIGTDGSSTPVGIAGRLRPRRLAEEAQLSPHGKRVAWSGNQRKFLHNIIKEAPHVKLL